MHRFTKKRTCGIRLTYEILSTLTWRSHIFVPSNQNSKGVWHGKTYHPPYKLDYPLSHNRCGTKGDPLPPDYTMASLLNVIPQYPPNKGEFAYGRKHSLWRPLNMWDIVRFNPKASWFCPFGSKSKMHLMWESLPPSLYTRYYLLSHNRCGTKGGALPLDYTTASLLNMILQLPFWWTYKAWCKHVVDRHIHENEWGFRCLINSLSIFSQFIITLVHYREIWIAVIDEPVQSLVHTLTVTVRISASTFSFHPVT